MIFRVLDIETVPDLRFWSKASPSYRLAPIQHVDGSGNGSLSTAGVLTEPGFPPPQAHRVVAISYVDILFDPACKPIYQFYKAYTRCEWSHDPDQADALEADLLSEFGASVTSHVPQIHFVSWNGRAFDLPVISLRSFLHRISCKWYYEGKDVRYRYSTEGHNDLMDYLSDYGACRPMSLSDACHLVGLPGKLDMTGASVESLYHSTKDKSHEHYKETIDSVKRYCLQDSIQTAIIFVMSRFHIGKITPDTLNAVLDTFKCATISEVIELDLDRLKVIEK